MTAKPWDEDLLADESYADFAIPVEDDPDWSGATELLWDEHLERRAGRDLDSDDPVAA